MREKWAEPPAPRHQAVLFTETLDDAIPRNHPIRLLDRCLDAVDWTLWENRYDGPRGFFRCCEPPSPSYSNSIHAAPAAVGSSSVIVSLTTADSPPEFFALK